MAIEKYLLHDGRRAEVREEVIEKDCENESVKEYYEEEKLPLHLTKRVLETKKPVVVERVVETIKDGEIIDRKRESLIPDKMELREHIALSSRHMVEEEENPCVTKEDLMTLLMEKNNRGVSDGQILVEQKQDEGTKISAWDILGGVIIVAQVVAIGYLIFML